MTESSKSRRRRADQQPERARRRERGRLELMPLWSVFRMGRPSGWIMLFAIASLVISASAELAIGQAVRNLFDKVLVAKDVSAINQYFLWFGLVIVVLAAATFGRMFTVAWLGERMVADVRKRVYGHLIGLSPRFFDQNKLGEILSRLTTDVAYIQTVVTATCPMATRSLFILVGGTVLMFITNVKLAAIVFGLVPLVMFPIIWFGRLVRRLSRTSQDRFAEVTAVAEETLSATQTVQAFTREDQERHRFGEGVEKALPYAVRRALARASLVGLAVLLMLTLINVGVWIGTNELLQDQMTLGELAAFIIYSFITALAVGNLSELWGSLQAASGASERLLEILATQPEITPPANPVVFPRSVEGQISFENVSFAYPSRSELVLREFSLDVSPGQSIALVGPSGSGKSTVFKLLLRFYDPQQGRILFDGNDLCDLDPTDLRSQISLVSQDPVIFGTSAIENIRYGKLEATDEEVLDAAQSAAAMEFLQELPDGPYTLLGPRGSQLSGGQRQRLAIARGILRNSAVLLLDEATSSLDSENERLVHEAIDNVTADRTSIIIAHRLATVKRADRIVVMDRGRIVAHGSHEELIEEGGLYARLARLQFAV